MLIEGWRRRRSCPKYRGYAARLNYLAADRPDIAYAVKEVCRGVAKPTRGHWKKLKRIAGT